MVGQAGDVLGHDIPLRAEFDRATVVDPSFSTTAAALPELTIGRGSKAPSRDAR